MAPHLSLLSRLQRSAFATAAASCLAARCNQLMLATGAGSTAELCTPQKHDLRAFSSNNTTDQQFFQHVPSKSQGATDSDSNRSSDGLKHFTTTSPEAVTSTGEEGVQGEVSHTVFTGTAEVKTDSSAQESDVATDANRRWMSADDLGTRATAATEGADANNTPMQQQKQQRDQGRSSEKSDDMCHPADPFCQAGEEAPMPDGFHEPEPGDDHIPPTSGFPA